METERTHKARRGWRTHDLVDLFDSTRRGFIPFQVRSNAWFNRDWDHISIKKLDANWPEGYRGWKEHGDCFYDYEPETKGDGVPYRNPRAILLLIEEQLASAIKDVNLSRLVLWNHVAEFFVQNFGIPLPKQNRAILEWAKKHTGLVISMLCPLRKAPVAAPAIHKPTSKKCPVCERMLMLVKGKIARHRERTDTRGYGNGAHCDYNESDVGSYEI